MVGYRPNFVRVFIKAKARSIKNANEMKNKANIRPTGLMRLDNIHCICLSAALADSRQSADQGKQPSAG